jgi:hypothetical protein
MSAADAVGVVRNGDMIIVPTAVGKLPSLLTALYEQRRDFPDVRVAQSQGKLIGRAVTAHSLIDFEDMRTRVWLNRIAQNGS